MSTSQRFLVRDGDRSTAVEALPDGRLRVAGAEDPFTVVQAADGSYLVGDGTRTWRVFVAGPPDARFVFADGAVATLEVAPDAPGRKRRRASHGDATAAPMPATVAAILVTVGQDVKQGDVVLKLEAMKMELPIRAHTDGTVAALRCRVGDLVQPGVPLIDIA